MYVFLILFSYFAVRSKWMSMNLKVHYGGTWEYIILRTVRGHNYKGGTFRDKLGYTTKMMFLTKNS